MAQIAGNCKARMTKEQLIARHAGGRIYCSVTRAGGMYRDIDKGVVYELRENGSMHYVCGTLCNHIANRAQRERWHEATGGHYFAGRQTAALLCERHTEEEIDAMFATGNRSR